MGSRALRFTRRFRRLRRLQRCRHDAKHGPIGRVVRVLFSACVCKSELRECFYHPARVKGVAEMRRGQSHSIVFHKAQPSVGPITHFVLQGSAIVGESASSVIRGRGGRYSSHVSSCNEFKLCSFLPHNATYICDLSMQYTVYCPTTFSLTTLLLFSSFSSIILTTGYLDRAGRFGVV